MEKVMKRYACWMEAQLPQDLKAELEEIKGNQEEIYDRFCRDMTFGTSGLRGPMGAGTSRINSVVLKRATRGLADYLQENRKESSARKSAEKIAEGGVESGPQKSEEKGAAEGAQKSAGGGAQKSAGGGVESGPQKSAGGGVESGAQRKQLSLALSYDTRIHSAGYGWDVAETLAAQGIHTWIVDRPQPVPLLSFAIREMGLDGGIMITASHNPKQYNGYKVYDETGNQIDDDKARAIEKYIAGREYFEKEEKAPRKEQEGKAAACGLIERIPEEVISSYQQNICRRAVWWSDDLQMCRDAMAQLSVVYTPLNGTGRDHVLEIFRRLGVGRVAVVASQGEGDGRFLTCPSPNPEYEKTFREAEKLAMSMMAEGQNPPDIIVATDPDCDRMGVMAWQPERKSYLLLSGNQVGSLLLDYLCTCLCGPDKRRLEGKKVYRSLVSSPFADSIARAYGISVEVTLTGFKNIAGKMEQLCEAGREEDFLFGFEESLGYLYGTYTRDKDGVMASQLIALAAARCKAQGITLPGRLRQLHSRLGYMDSRAWSLRFQREKDRKTMEKIMEALFAGQLNQLIGMPVVADLTYQKEGVFQGALVDRSGGSSGGIDEGGSRGTSCSADGSGERGWCSDANGGSSIGNDCSDCSGGSIDGDNGSGDGAGASGGGDLRRHRFIVRPSGTELKLKAYVFAEGSQEEEASEEADRIMGELKSWLSHKKEEIEYNE